MTARSDMDQAVDDLRALETKFAEDPASVTEDDVLNLQARGHDAFEARWQQLDQHKGGEIKHMERWTAFNRECWALLASVRG